MLAENLVDMPYPHKPACPDSTIEQQISRDEDEKEDHEINQDEHGKDDQQISSDGDEEGDKQINQHEGEGGQNDLLGIVEYSGSKRILVFASTN